jgi:hypothetical protein
MGWGNGRNQTVFLAGAEVATGVDVIWAKPFAEIDNTNAKTETNKK